MKRLLPFILAGALSAVAVMPAAAQTECETTNVAGVPGILALVAANVQAGVTACDIDVDILNRSLNNLLRNANIEVLNNSPILSQNDITITVDDVLNNLTISVLGGPVITVGL